MHLHFSSNCLPGPATDAWSLGVVLFYALTGTSPFDRGNLHATISAVMYDDYPTLVGTDPSTELYGACYIKTLPSACGSTMP